MFQSAQRLAPGEAQLLHLELTLLLSQGRQEEARLRAPVLAARARKADWNDLAGMLLKLGEDGVLNALHESHDDSVDDSIDEAWVALCEQVPERVSPTDCGALYQLTLDPPQEPGRPPVLTVRADKVQASVQRRWRRIFHVKSPRSPCCMAMWMTCWKAWRMCRRSCRDARRPGCAWTCWTTC